MGKYTVPGNLVRSNGIRNPSTLIHIDCRCFTYSLPGSRHVIIAPPREHCDNQSCRGSAKIYLKMCIKPCPQGIKAWESFHQRLSGSICHIRAIILLGKRILSQSFLCWKLPETITVTSSSSVALALAPSHHTTPACWTGYSTAAPPLKVNLPFPSGSTALQLLQQGQVRQSPLHRPVTSKFQWSCHLWFVTSFYWFKTISPTLLRWVYNLRIELR